MAETRVCLVRHGETAWNVERRLQGHLDVPLNQAGMRQAEALATALSGTRFDAVYCSDLSRARMTAEAASRALGHDPIFDEALRERHYGAFQGLSYTEASARFPGDYQRFMERDPGFAFPEGGESLLAFHARITTVLHRLAHRHLGCAILVVTHGGVLDIVHRIATGKRLEAKRDFEIPNAALNWVGFDDGQWRLMAWADRRHLDQTLDELHNA